MFLVLGFSVSWNFAAKIADVVRWGWLIAAKKIRLNRV